MTDFASKADPAPPPDNLDQWRQLRSLIVGPEREHIEAVQALLDDPVLHAESISTALPDAITLASERSDRLAEALQPSIDGALRASVRRDPAAIADAIFPALGPGIRKAVTAAITRMVQSLNRVLTEGLSLRSLRWRWQAWISHRPYAEIVLLHHLVYRIEQLLLIHRSSGILLAKAATESTEPRDPDQVAGMLTAIQDFVRDAFGTSEGEVMHAFETDAGQAVWIETGPEATLAAVIRGTPPLHLRAQLQKMLEEIHLLFRRKLDTFDGDPSPFRLVQPKLEEALSFEIRDPAPRSRAPAWIAASAGVLAAVTWISMTIGEHRRWNHFLELVRAEPGIVVLEADKRGATWELTGLRDPISRDPAVLLDRAGIPREAVTATWSTYFAADDDLAARRATARLHPPESVALEVVKGTLMLSGSATHDWIARARRDAGSIVGVDAIDFERLEDTQARALEHVRQSLERSVLYFERARGQPSPGQEDAIDTIETLVREAQQLSRHTGVPLRIVIVGHADPTGARDFNHELSNRRALSVLRLLETRGVDTTSVSVSQAALPASSSPSAATELAALRKVTFSVLLGNQSRS